MRSTTRMIPKALTVLALALGAFSTLPVYAVSVETPAGTNVQINPFEELTIIFDRVLDPAPTEVVKTELEPGDRTTPCGNTIPAFVGLPTGFDHFVVYRIDTMALFTDSVEVILDNFDEADRLFHAACPPDADGFLNVTTLAIPGDPRARIPNFSEFVVGIDTRPIQQVITAQMDVFKEILGVGSPASLAMDDMTLFVLRNYGRDVVRARMDENYPLAYEILGEMINYVRAHSGETIPNRAGLPGGNAAGELISIGAALKFSFKTLF